MIGRSREFDAIVAGGGLAGLTCSALLSKAGYRVLLLEKNVRLGGYAVSYRVREHRFDIAVQAIGGCEPGGIISNVLETAGCRDRVRFLICEPARAYFMDDSDTPWLQEGKWRKTADALTLRYPEYAWEIGECYRIWDGILSELVDIAKHEPGKVAYGFTRKYPLLTRYGDYTLEDFYHELGLPGKIQSLVSARSGYCMLEPRRLSVIGFACTEMTYGNGAWLVEGGIGRLAAAMAGVLREMGGEIRTCSRVVRITTKQGQVRGVRTKDGSFHGGRLVVIASDARQALNKRLDAPELLPGRYLERLNRMEPTGSYYIAYFSISEDALEGLYPNIEVRGAFAELKRGWAPRVYYIFVPSMVDNTAAPQGLHCLCLSIPCPYGLVLDRKEREKCRDFLKSEVSKRFPGLRGRMMFMFDLGPSNLAAISGSPDGSAYGWAQIPRQSGVKRLNIKTPVPGLYLCGHWTMPGGGIAGVIASGRLCAETVLADERSQNIV